MVLRSFPKRRPPGNFSICEKQLTLRRAGSNSCRKLQKWKQSFTSLVRVSSLQLLAILLKHRSSTQRTSTSIPLTRPSLSPSASLNSQNRTSVLGNTRKQTFFSCFHEPLILNTINFRHFLFSHRVHSHSTVQPLDSLLQGQYPDEHLLAEQRHFSERVVGP